MIREVCSCSAEIEQFVIKELTMTMQVPTDGSDDSQNVLR